MHGCPSPPPRQTLGDDCRAPDVDQPYGNIRIGGLLRGGLPVNALVARIDVERMEAADPPNLTSAIRQWLWHARSADQTAA